MTPTTVAVGSPRRTIDGFGTAGLVAAGVGVLLLRALLLESRFGGAELALVYVLLGLAFVRFPAPTDRGAALRPAWVIAIGLAGVALAAASSGPSLEVPHGAGVLALNSLAAVSEEIFFRRYLYGRLVHFGPAVAIAITALLFAVVHVPVYGAHVFWVDLGAGLLLSWQRWASGGWAGPAVTHVGANILAMLR
jgi:membrane protease YdiL (CAAX protease family)